ncbi:uncharacterized protein LOC118157080 [Oxyura jamaicensis]|uniref:uncharacterized protein LOC118157077 n=1 Tax=Oxyura jamaicensis TaxID=8884 RepID=UPI0015A5BEC0|nr:uncharacterized protein LOC118157077 [Oxyura jamaicensis]XP_035167212.1 uncharacterized protein LOC118157080 [Oxyura jamaicensis]
MTWKRLPSTCSCPALAASCSLVQTQPRLFQAFLIIPARPPQAPGVVIQMRLFRLSLGAGGFSCPLSRDARSAPDFVRDGRKDGRKTQGAHAAERSNAEVRDCGARPAPEVPGHRSGPAELRPDGNAQRLRAQQPEPPGPRSRTAASPKSSLRERTARGPLCAGCCRLTLSHPPATPQRAGPGPAAQQGFSPRGCGYAVRTRAFFPGCESRALLGRSVLLLIEHSQRFAQDGPGVWLGRSHPTAPGGSGEMRSPSRPAELRHMSLGEMDCTTPRDQEMERSAVSFPLACQMSYG